MGNIVLIEIKAWWLLIVPFLLVLCLFVIALIMRNSPDGIEEEQKEEEKKKKKQTLISWITKKDILYWFLIVCLGAIGIFTFQYRGDADVISHWGFAGTIVSIILAVIAIGFTLFQTLSHNLSSEKIAESAEKIEKASSGLDNTELLRAGEIIKNTSQNIAEFNMNVETRLEKMTAEIMSMKEAHLNSNIKIDRFFFNKEESEFNGNENDDSIEKMLALDLDKFLNEVFPNLAEIPRFFLYSSLVLIETDTLTEKQKQMAFLRKLTDLEYNQRIKGEGVVEGEQKRVQLTGAYMGSLGAVGTMIKNMGIYKAFKERDEQSKRALLIKAEESISTEHKDFLKQFTGTKE